MISQAHGALISAITVWPWPLNLTSIIIPLDINAKFLTCMSLCSAKRVRRTHAMSKLLHPTRQRQDVAWENAVSLHCIRLCQGGDSNWWQCMCARMARVPFWPTSVRQRVGRVLKQCATKGRVLNTKCMPERLWFFQWLCQGECRM